MAVRREHTVPILVIGLGVLLVMTAGTLLIGPRLRAAERTVGSAPSTSPRPSLPVGSGYGDPTGSVDEATRRATVNGATITLPADPFAITQDPVAIKHVFDVCFLAEAVVHPRSSTTPGWGVMVGLAHLDPELERKLDADPPMALPTIAQEFFGSYPTELADAATSSAVVDGHPALRVTATVHYDVEGLPSTHDAVTALVIDLPDGGTVVAMTSVPNDAPVELRRMAEKSLKSLTIG